MQTCRHADMQTYMQTCRHADMHGMQERQNNQAGIQCLTRQKDMQSRQKGRQSWHAIQAEQARKTGRAEMAFRQVGRPTGKKVDSHDIQ
jgi:hypothetical protein